jgi:hypothetical protein
MKPKISHLNLRPAPICRSHVPTSPTSRPPRLSHPPRRSRTMPAKPRRPGRARALATSRCLPGPPPPPPGPHDRPGRISNKHSELRRRLILPLGRDYTKNEFPVVAMFQDNTITLQDSVAIRDVVGPRMYEYFKIKVVNPDGDLTISVTPFSGDPDLYISPAPEAHPRKENYTWASRGFGATRSRCRRKTRGSTARRTRPRAWAATSTLASMGGPTRASASWRS